ncbi:alcohol dehydrogenase catalytic domain-containing protein [Myxococcota bacterium]|nr:alcohol dehydrogenase catalytic domain-containing protein [Myxococcota bacterium]
MKCVRRTERGIEVEDHPVPDHEGVRIHVRSVGICQTDVNLARMGPMPHTLGHEFAGELEDGTPVGVEPMIPCGDCDQCQCGDYLYCKTGYQMIVGIGHDGGMADQVVLPQRCLVPLPRGLEARDACLIEPLAVNLHSLALAGFKSGERVCVVGAGLTGFGLLAAAAAKFRGAVVDLDPEHDHGAAAAQRLGIGTDPTGHYDIVMEANGSEASIEKAAQWCRPAGTVLLVAGYYSDKRLSVQTYVAKELRMVWGTWYGHHAAGRSVDSAAALLARQPTIAAELISHRMPLDAATEAFALIESQTPSLKVVLEP